MTSRRDYPLTSPSRALGPLVIVTSVIGSTGRRGGVEEEVEGVPSPESLLIANGALGDISALAFELELCITVGTVARTGIPTGMGIQELRPLIAFP
jgi:hypothetical protein